MREVSTRREPGTRPAEPVRLCEPPDDYLCSWSVSEVCGEDGTRSQVWTLKFISALCSAHARLGS